MGNFSKSKEVNKMPKCKDCKFFKPTHEGMGDCFGVEVSGERNADECPANAFEPK